MVKESVCLVTSLTEWEYNKCNASGIEGADEFRGGIAANCIKKTGYSKQGTAGSRLFGKGAPEEGLCGRSGRWIAVGD